MCQVCHHEPLDKSLCEPNKTLRMTVKAILKKKLVEKATQRKREEAAKAEAAKAEAKAQSQPVAYEDAKPEGGIQSGQADETTYTTPTKPEDGDASQSSIKPNTSVEGTSSTETSREVQDIPQPSIEV